MGWFSNLLEKLRGPKMQSMDAEFLPGVYPGVLLEPRTAEDVERDYDIRELVAGFAAVQWIETPANKIRQFPVQDQSQKNDCVAETRRKLYRILFKVNRNIDLDFSSVYAYRKRSNYPDPGMAADDAIRISREGITLNALMQSEPLVNDTQANAVKIEQYHIDVAQDFKIPNEVKFVTGDIEPVASTIQLTRKGVMGFFYFTNDEWSREVPIILVPGLNPASSQALRHAVTIVEPALYNGKKGVWIEDSAHFGGLARRFITEEFFRARNFWVSYPINFVFEPGADTKPQHRFDRDLKLGDNNGEVKALQECLQYEGCFPSNTDTTGLYGGITAAAVYKFQVKYNVAPIAELNDLQGKNVGAKTRAALNARFA